MTTTIETATRELRNQATFAVHLPGDPAFRRGGEAAVAEAIAEGLRRRGYRVGCVLRRPWVGWEFMASRGIRRSWCLLERGDHWLFVCEPRPSFVERLLAKYFRSVERTLVDLEAVFADEPRFRDVRWSTREEYDRTASIVEDAGPSDDTTEEAPEAEEDAESPEELSGSDELVNEGQALSRPCLELYAVPGDLPPVGVWKADRTWSAADGRALVHVISVDCRWLHAAGFALSGTLSVFDDDGDDPVVMQEVMPVSEILELGGTALRGRQEQSFPPREALFHFGRKPGASASRYALERYDEVFYERGCFRTPGPTAILGGWHMSWPDSGTYDRPGRLALITLRDAEPWYEVWMDEEGRLTVASRIT